MYRDTKAEILQGFVEGHTATDAIVYTDEAKAYKGIDRTHEAVKHSVGEYVRDMAHTNGMESFWATLKRGYNGTFHHMSIRLNQAHFSTHNLSALISAFPVSISFRMRAVSAIFGAFPDATILSYFALRSGLNRAATRAGM